MILRVDETDPIDRPPISPTVEWVSTALTAFGFLGAILGLGIFLLAAPEWSWWRLIRGGIGSVIIGLVLGTILGLPLARSRLVGDDPQ